MKKEQENMIVYHTRKKKSLITGLSIAVAIPIIVTFIVNLSVNRTLDWFFVVLTALIVFTSVTLVPLIVEKNRGLWTLVCFTGSLLLALFTISCLYSSGHWFLIAAVSVIFGMSVFFVPYVLAKLPLPEIASRNKGFLAMVSNTLLLYALIFVIGNMQTNTGYWWPALFITTVCALFAWLLFLTIRYLKTNTYIKAGLCFIYSGLFHSMIGNVIDWTLDGIWHNRLRDASLFPVKWGDYHLIDANIALLALLTGCIVGGILVVVGMLREKRS